MIRTPPIALVALLLAGGAPPSPLRAESPAADRPGRDQRFEDALVVREVEVRFDLSVLPNFESLGKKGQLDFVLVEEGATRRTLRFEVAPEAGGWDVLLWFDDGFADGGARSLAARALAERAPRLVAAGSVEVVEAGEGIVSSGPVTSAPELTERLLRIARRAETEPAAPAPDVVRASARLDRLAAAIADRQGAGARTLVLPLSSWQVDAALLDELGRARSGAQPTARTRPLVEAARALAGYGWITFGLALQPAVTPVAAQASPSDATVSTGAAGEERTFAPFRRPGSQSETTAREQAQLDNAVDLGLAPGGDLVRPGSGAVAAHSGQLDDLLHRLFSRARLIAAAPESPPGRLLSRQVLWIGGDKRPLPALAVARSSTPPEIAAARLRRALAGAAPGALDARIVVDRRGAAPRVCLAEGVARGWIRLSSGRAVGREPRLTIGAPIELSRPAEEGGGTQPPARVCAAWPAAASADTVLLVEDLDRESWTTF